MTLGPERPHRRTTDEVRDAPFVASFPLPAPDRPVVLFALFDAGRPTVSLLRTVELARLLEAEVRIMRVLPEKAVMDDVLRRADVVDAVRTVEETLHAYRATKEWLREVLDEGDPEPIAFTVAHGDFVERVAEHAVSVEATLVVVPPREGGTGRAAIAIACRSGVPVLVARGAKRGETIVAATDMETEKFPVLRHAAELGRQLDAPVVAVHNVGPTVQDEETDPARAADAEREAILRHRSARLARVSDGIASGASSVVRAEPSAADAILAEARARDADLVVVGTNATTPQDRVAAGSVAAEVVNRAARSVLVMPFDPVA